MIGLIAGLQLLGQVWPGWDSLYSVELVKAIALYGIYFAIDFMMATDMPLRHANRADPTALYMSVFLGLYQFGIAGIIYGPLLVLTGTLVYHSFNVLRRV